MCLGLCEKFLRICPKVPGTRTYSCGSNLQKGGVPGKFPGKHSLLWFQMWICATEPNAQVSVNQGRRTTSTVTGQMQFGNFWVCLSATMFHIADDGVAYENHSAIMQVQQPDPNARMGNHSLLVFPRTAKRIPEKTISELTGQGWCDEHLSHSIVSEVSKLNHQQTKWTSKDRHYRRHLGAELNLLFAPPPFSSCCVVAMCEWTGFPSRATSYGVHFPHFHRQTLIKQIKHPCLTCACKRVIETSCQLNRKFTSVFA